MYLRTGAPPSRNLLELAKESARSRAYESAIALCAEAESKGAPNLDVMRTRIYIHERSKNYPAAIKVLESLCNIDESDIGDFYHLGLMNLAVEDYEADQDAFNQAMKLSSSSMTVRYKEPFHLLRAFAFFKVGKIAEAEDDLAQVRDQSSSYVPGYGLLEPSRLRAELSNVPVFRRI